MYTQVASKLAVVSGTDSFSQAVSMAGGNAVEVEATLYAKGTNALTITVQVSNDLENWADAPSGPHLTMSTVGADQDQVPSISAAYVRLKYVQDGGTSIVAAGINVANL